MRELEVAFVVAWLLGVVYVIYNVATKKWQ